MNQAILSLTCNKGNIQLLPEQWLQTIGRVLAGIAISALESRLGFPVEPWLDGVGRVWMQNIVRAANRFFQKLA